ncbi:unnamed protein product [Vicia faba]|uniref:Retrotransposon gag domain-containing protein n=1 Tax=Vicia faba TaxID=3906 RepID=A0AAV1AP51_VICFA|nr:unnamed protein product [Vicia faba]
MWSYVNGTSVKPTDKKNEAKYAKELETWDVSNSKILTWINNSVSQSIGVQLSKYDTAKESDIRALKQNNMTIQEFYSAMSNLWDKLALMESTELKVVKAYTDQRE